MGRGKMVSWHNREHGEPRLFFPSSLDGKCPSPFVASTADHFCEGSSHVTDSTNCSSGERV